MITVSCIVEGHGEERALPLLLRRLTEWRSPGTWVNVLHPIRVHRDRFLNRPAEFTRYLTMAGNQCGDNGWVLILLDADDDCPVDLGTQLLTRAGLILPTCTVSAVIANREFEAWFIGAAESLNGYRGFAVNPRDLAAHPETPRDAKGWIKSRIAGGRYGEVVDQPAFASRMDLQQAHDRCRSFKKLCNEWDRKLAQFL